MDDVLLNFLFKESSQKSNTIYTQILSSLTVFNIDYNKNYFLSTKLAF